MKRINLKLYMCLVSFVREPFVSSLYGNKKVMFHYLGLSFYRRERETDIMSTVGLLTHKTSSFGPFTSVICKGTT